MEEPSRGKTKGHRYNEQGNSLAEPGLMERHTLLLEQRVSVGVTSLQWSSVYCFPPFLSFSGRRFYDPVPHLLWLFSC